MPTAGEQCVVSKSGGATVRLIREEGPPRHYESKPLAVPVDEPLRPSVVIPFYNRDEMVFECVESVLIDAPIGCEVVVVDDGSDDPTVIARLQEAYPSIVCVRLPENKGVSVARNRGNAVASGEVIIDLDSDDVLLSFAIQSVLGAIDTGPDFVYGDILKGAERREVRRPEWEANILLRKGCFITGLKAYRKALWRRVGGFDETLRSAVDLDFALRCEEAGAVFQRVPDFLVVYREHEGQISQQDKEEQRQNAKHVLSSAINRRQ